jgi:uncharacterized membrane protein
VDVSGAAAARRASLLLAIVAGAGFGALLWHLLYRGLAHSFDPMIYARAIWGIGRGDFFNSIMSMPSFAVHGQWHQLLLAPLTWFLNPALVLIITQSVAAGATVWLAARAFADAAGDASRTRSAIAGALLVLASPLITNPFLFDVRPEMVAVPLIAAGLLRAERRNELDATAIALLASGVVAREDFAILVCPALVLMPVARGVTMRTRLIAAIALGAYLLFYLFVLRRIIGDAGVVEHGFGGMASRLLNPAADAVERVPVPDLLRYKIEIAIIAVASMGAFVLRAKRWLLIAIPALLVVLAQNRLQAWILNTHYSMFAAPALLAAGVAGYRSWVGQGRPRRQLTITVATLVAVMSFLGSSAAPGGGRYRENRFCWDPAAPFTDSVSKATTEIHALLNTVPGNEGLAVPFWFGATLSGRRVIHNVENLPREMINDAHIPDGVQWIALLPSHWDYGRRLIGRGDFVLHAEVPRALVLLRRRDGAGSDELP